MGILDRFFGRGGKAGAPAANPSIENPLSLQILFAKPAEWDAFELTRELRRYHPSLHAATFEIESTTAVQRTPIGLAAWGNHVVRVVAFDAPMPAENIQLCIQASHYGPELKSAARAHKAHAILFYGGTEESALEQYVALGVVAGALSRIGGMVVVNESARTSFPAKALAVAPNVSDMLNVLRTMPMLYLYCGFAKYTIDGVDGTWMRTHGNHLLGIPDLAYHASGHQEGGRIHETFSNIMTYLLTSNARIDAGHTMQIAEDAFIKLRAPRTGEYFLESPTELFVLEFVSSREINRK